MSIQAMLDESIGVKFIQYVIGIALVTCSEDYNLELFSHFFQETESIGTDRYITKLSFINLHLNIALVYRFLVAVNQCFVKIDD